MLLLIAAGFGHIAHMRDIVFNAKANRLGHLNLEGLGRHTANADTAMVD